MKTTSNEFNYHLRGVMDHFEDFITELEVLRKQKARLTKEIEATRLVLECLPNAAEIVKIADKIKRGVPLFSRTEITEIQEGLKTYAQSLKDLLDASIAEIDKAIKLKQVK